MALAGMPRAVSNFNSLMLTSTRWRVAIAGKRSFPTIDDRSEPLFLPSLKHTVHTNPTVFTEERLNYYRLLCPDYAVSFVVVMAGSYTHRRTQTIHHYHD